jgi:hypothetical protein
MDGGEYDEGFGALFEDGACCDELEGEGEEVED